MAGFRDVVGRALQAGLDLLNKQAESGGQGGRQDGRGGGRPEGAGVRQAPTGDRARQISYAPDLDGRPDAGEIVWTWVPFEENDGRGKDRPVLVIGRHGPDRVYAVRLTSKPHDRDRDFVPLGAGAWDASGRASWVDIEQLYSVHPVGMRREAAALDRARFRAVADALRARYGWTSRAG